jgi:hypothetical protein
MQDLERRRKNLVKHTGMTLSNLEVEWLKQVDTFDYQNISY